MKKIFILMSIVNLYTGIIWAQAIQSDGFTYQGRLMDSGIPADGTYNFTFDLYEFEVGGILLDTMTLTNVTVTEGLFTVELDYGAVFDGYEKWLEIKVDGTVLSPRQKLTSIPYSLFALDIADDSITSSKIYTGAVGPDALENTSVTPGTYGSANSYPQITVDADGRLINANNISISDDDDWAYSSGSGLTGDIYHSGNVALGSYTNPDMHGLNVQNYEAGKAAVRGVDGQTLVYAEGQLGVYNQTNSLGLPVDVLNAGVLGLKPTTGAYGAAIYGWNNDDEIGNNYAGIFIADGTNNGSNYAIYGSADNGSSNFAGFFTGRVDINGNADDSNPVLDVEVNYSDTQHIRAINASSYPADGWGYGVYGSGGKYGIYGYNNANAYTGTSGGGYFYTTGTAGSRYGVYAVSNGSVAYSFGVYGLTTGSATYSRGVYGNALAISANNYGVYGKASNATTANYGVFAEATDNVSATNYGLYANADNGDTNYAGYFDGRVDINGLSDDSNTVLNVETMYTGSVNVTGIESYSVPADGYGTGLHASGGQVGVMGQAYGGTSTGQVVGGYFTSAGSSAGTRIAIYANANGGLVKNWAGYFNQGNVFIQNELLIGTDNGAAGYAVSVDGKIACEDILIEDSGSWPDYVFADDYNLMSIDQLETTIRKTKQLPGIPSVADIEKQGIQVGQMQKKTMEKIEELTLYIIEMNSRLKTLEHENAQLRAQLMQ